MLKMGGMCFMINNKNDIIDDLDEGEDSTKYGEFVTSYFAWVPLSQQKEKVKKLENITKKKEK